MSITLMFGGLLVRGPSSHLTLSFVKMKSLLTKKKKGKGMRKGDYWVESISSHQLQFLHLSSFYHSAHASGPPLKTKVFQFSSLTTVLLLLLLSYASSFPMILCLLSWCSLPFNVFMMKFMALSSSLREKCQSWPNSGGERGLGPNSKPQVWLHSPFYPILLLIPILLSQHIITLKGGFKPQHSSQSLPLLLFSHIDFSYYSHIPILPSYPIRLLLHPPRPPRPSDVNSNSALQKPFDHSGHSP